MDNENKQRISLYLDRSLVKKADKIIKEYGYKSRNDLYSAAVEDFITVEILKENESFIVEKLSKAIADLSKNNSKAISQGLFRYAVQLEMVMRIIAELSELTEDEIRRLRNKSINNVKRLKGRIHIEDVIAGSYNDYEIFTDSYDDYEDLL